MRFFSALLVATFALCSAAFAQSEAYPNRPVKVIVPLTRDRALIRLDAS